MNGMNLWREARPISPAEIQNVTEQNNLQIVKFLFCPNPLAPRDKCF